MTSSLSGILYRLLQKEFYIESLAHVEWEAYYEKTMKAYQELERKSRSRLEPISKWWDWTEKRVHILNFLKS